MTTLPPGSALTPEVLGELRHELRTPLNHVIGYAEMLLEDMPESAAAHRARLEETLAAARAALALINDAIGSTKNARAADVEHLYEALQEPRTRIIGAGTALLMEAAVGDDSTLADDLRKILSAANRLAPPGGETPARTAASTVERPAVRAPANGDAAAPDDTRRARILVVDDVAENRDVLSRRLERAGHQVTAAEHGRRALELLGERPFDLVLLDVMMPELDGYGVLEAIKGTPTLRDIPVIMISALDELPSIVRCIERGAEDYLHKPFDPVLLRARVNASLEKKRLRDQEVDYLREVGRVIDAATAVETGAYDHNTLAPVARRADELGRLARVFDNMVNQIKAREDRLRDQVRDLREEIEWARKNSKEMPLSVDGGNLRIGERIANRYEILTVLGRGGMGTVYRARDHELSEDVAIKTLRPELVSDAGLVERFKDEIRLARRLSDQRIVRTHDFGEWAGVYYLTMEYVEGITVRELLNTRGRLGVSAALAIATQLAKSLAVAHEHGVIHRDIKPQNLLLDADGVLKVMDFGVARLAERTTALTEAGLIVGTPTYMPPEQLMADNVDARSDLYAAGVVLYECLTGEPPFQSSTVVSLVAKVLTQPPRAPGQLNPELPPALEALILQLLAKKPEDRVQTALELAERLTPLG